MRNEIAKLILSIGLGVLLSFTLRGCAGEESANTTVTNTVTIDTVNTHTVDSFEIRVPYIVYRDTPDTILVINDSTTKSVFNDMASDCLDSSRLSVIHSGDIKSVEFDYVCKTKTITKNDTFRITIKDSVTIKPVAKKLSVYAQGDIYSNNTTAIGLYASYKYNRLLTFGIGGQRVSGIIPAQTDGTSTATVFVASVALNILSK